MERQAAVPRPSLRAALIEEGISPVAWLRALGVVAVLAAAAMMPACGSQPLAGATGAGSFPAAPSASSSPPGTPSSGSSSPSPPGASSPSPGSGQSDPAVVHLVAGFSPRMVRLRVGQQFLLVVSKDVQASGVPWPGGCPPGTVRPVASGLLTAQCMTGSRYLYTARRAGTATVTATVRPRCAPGSMCPQWITAPRLTVIIS